mgnify:CR=1 FL=1
MLVLRDYQAHLIDEAREHIRAGCNAVLIQSPTASGKTVLIAHMLRHATSKGYRAWFVVHRRELVKQSVATLTEAAGLDVGIVAAGFPGNRKQNVQVCSIQTLRGRQSMLPDPSLIIWDECHHVAAGSWSEIFTTYSRAAHIGLTATPERLDGVGLGGWFKELVTGPTVTELIDDGWLSPFKIFAPPGPDVSAVHIMAGDYNRKELSSVMDGSAIMGDVLTHYRKLANGKRMVLFAWSISSSIDLAARFCAAGIAAEHVDGTTSMDGRDAAMERFRRGQTLVLTNVDLFGEGLDVPAIEAVALLRPTQSLMLYLQQVGRALRPAPGKDYAVILDHAGNALRHGLPDDARAWSLQSGRRKRVGDDAAPIRQCPQCYAVMPAARPACMECGFKFAVIGREIDEVAGELREVEDARAKRIEQGQARTLDDLIAIGRTRGYKCAERWAQMVYRGRLAKKAAAEAVASMQRGIV